MYRERVRRPSKSQDHEVPEEKKSKSAPSKRIRCGRCGPCNTADCGKCEHCKKKKKFGGDGSSRQACIKRNCEAIHGDSAPISTAQVKAPPGAQAGNHMRKEPPPSFKASLSRTSAQAPSETTGVQLDSSSENNGGKFGNSKKKTPVKRSFTFMTKMEASLFSPALSGEDQKEMEQEDEKSEEFDGSKDPEQDSQEVHKRKKALPTKYFRRFMGRIPTPKPELGACAKCGYDDDNPSNPILLCDGPDCEREYHLTCAGLEEVPEGDWYCVDCHPTGSGYDALVDYLEHMDETRSEHPNSAVFCMALAKRDLSGTKSSKIPESELKIAIRDMSPEEGWLIGKPVWIRLPKLNRHVPGRIINQRPATQLDSDALLAKPQAPGSIGAQEYFVRFAAGHFDRKETYYHWIRLEEHQLMIGDCFLWASCGDGVSELAPAFSVLRTSRDLILDLPRKASMSKSSAKKSAPGLAKSNASQQPLKARGSISSTAFFYHVASFEKLVYVAPDDFFDPTMLTKYGFPSATAAAKAELQEQQSVRNWQNLPQGNPFHAAALKSRDHFSLPPIIPRDKRHTTKTNIALSEGELHTKLCPVVMNGIDPSYIMDLLKKNHGLEPSKQLAASLTCEFLPYRWPRKETEGEEPEPPMPPVKLET